jgi:hypothetical protein
MIKHVTVATAAVILASASGVLLAQNAPPPSPDPLTQPPLVDAVTKEAPPKPIAGQIIMQDKNTYLASALIGSWVHSPDNQTVGDVNDVIINPSGDVVGVVIGVGGRSISRERAMDHIFGYTCFNDVSVRDVQNLHVQWFRGKSLDGTCPFGPWIITADEVPNPHNLKIECRVNGVVKQTSNTSLLINDLREIIYHLSNGLTLEPGDLISTGTPSGIGHARVPPEYLKPGDVVEVDIEGVGILRNPVVDINER